ncbi:hypothetical protein EZS27_026354 [termite gut metagenome]|uniref:DUF4868 domain-containing protein n=1 Tax=termite gut metagenome TaxID=433724 RepID=A0A5J4QUQ0_9ZZZZ
MTINELLDKVSATNVEDAKLYFITRILRDGIKKSAKLMDKFIFKVYQVDIDDEIRQYLYDCSKEQLEHVIKKDFEMIDYDVISDDTEHLFTYSMKNKAMSFADFVLNKLNSNTPKVMGIDKIISDIEELWAYCVGFNDVENSDWIYTFRKIQSGKVAVDEKENQKTLVAKAIRTLFNTQSKKLELLKGETVNLDKQIDCVYYGETFYVIKKGYFEQIIGLQEEYKEQSKQVASEMKQTNMFEGLDKIEEEIEKNPAIHKKLVRIAKIGNYREITPQIVKKMEKVCKKYGNKLNVKNGKLAIEEKEDIDTILKMLADYYKTGDVTGKPYGTFSGKEIKLEV